VSKLATYTSHQAQQDAHLTLTLLEFLSVARVRQIMLLDILGYSLMKMIQTKFL
jgi:hypothetical protein